MPVTFATLQHKHPDYDLMADRWVRYRAVMDGIESNSEKRAWLPQGKMEWNILYEQRLNLTKFIGWSAPAVDRMAGSLTKHPAKIDLEKSALTPQVQGRLEEFRRNWDGTGKTSDAWWKDIEPDVLSMGVQIVEVARDDISGAKDVIEESLPFCCVWQPEELWDWELDAKGNPLWVKLVRTELMRESHEKPPEEVTTFKILTRSGGMIYHQKKGQDNSETASEPKEWQNSIGICPVVVVPARSRRAMTARSYIDQISLADIRVLQLESDQAMSSYLHGSPLMKVWSDQALGTEVDKDEDGEVTKEGLGLGTSQILLFSAKVDGGPQEDAEYMTLDTGGMEIREDIISRTQSQALNAAGIDPSTVISGAGGGSGPRSGASLAWSFSTAEEPALNAFTDGMDAAERQIMEIATRFLLPKPSGDPSERMFDGVISRTRKWDLMSAETTVSLGSAAYDMIPSATARRRIASEMYRAVDPKADDDTKKSVDDELDQAITVVQRPVLVDDTEPDVDETDEENE